MDERLPCEIIVIGNEILSGFVKDTNSHWLIDRLTEIGGKIERVSCIGDDISVIGKEIKSVFERDSKFIVCSGGLGPTDDDITLEGIAKGLNLPIVQDQKALAMIKERYEALLLEGKTDRKELTTERIKMSYLPFGSIPLFNAIGTAPAILLKYADKYIVSLPGVPDELKYIFENSLKPYIDEIFPENIGRFEESIFLNITDESLIAEKLKEIRNIFKDLYIKSKPGKKENLFKVEIVFYGIGEKEKVKRRIKDAVELFKTENSGGI